MANNTQQTTAVTQNDGEAKQLVVDARFIMRSYEDKDKVNREYLSFELINPFGDEEMFQNIALKAKWDKYDEKTGRLTRPDRVFGYMSYYAKKALRTMPDVCVKVTIKPVNYKSKKTGAMVTYPAMFAAPTFAELEDERPVEVVVKGANDSNTFDLLAGKALGIKFASRDKVDDEDIGLDGTSPL